MIMVYVNIMHGVFINQTMNKSGWSVFWWTHLANPTNPLPLPCCLVLGQDKFSKWLWISLRTLQQVSTGPGRKCRTLQFRMLGEMHAPQNYYGILSAVNRWTCRQKTIKVPTQICVPFWKWSSSPCPGVMPYQNIVGIRCCQPSSWIRYCQPSLVCKSTFFNLRSQRWSKYIWRLWSPMLECRHPTWLQHHDHAKTHVTTAVEW